MAKDERKSRNEEEKVLKVLGCTEVPEKEE
jgi:hypothetical protein